MNFPALVWGQKRREHYCVNIKMQTIRLFLLSWCNLNCQLFPVLQQQKSFPSYFREWRCFWDSFGFGQKSRISSPPFLLPQMSMLFPRPNKHHFSSNYTRRLSHYNAQKIKSPEKKAIIAVLTKNQVLRIILTTAHTCWCYETGCEMQTFQKEFSLRQEALKVPTKVWK